MKKDNVICNEKDLQLGTEYFFSEIGVRLWRERAFHPKLLKDPLYMEEMQDRKSTRLNSSHAR